LTEVLHAADPSRKARSQLSAFARFASDRTGRRLESYAELHAFSVEDVGAFWTLFLEWSKVRWDGSLLPACEGLGVEGTRFFPGIRLSWAENLLVPGGTETEAAPAIIARDESGHRLELSRVELRARVRAIAAALAARGLKAGDRVVAVARNTAEPIVACLAATSVGASWSSVAPDMGLDAAMSRFSQLAPRVLFAHRESSLNGARLAPDLRALRAGLTSLDLLVWLDDGPEDPALDVPQATLSALAAEGRTLPGGDPEAPFHRFPFDHPLFILFSSGTTGVPKCIVHGHGGTLLEHLKELRLHCDLTSADRMLFQTSTGWMMWNWMFSSLATGASVVVYDGSVSYPERDSLLRVVAEEEVTVFGTSPAYLQYLSDAGVSRPPGAFPALREMHSTGSVLYPHVHRWAKDNLADVPLQSISGGTDIVGCFVMGQPWGEVHAGESTCVGLGLDVRAAGHAGTAKVGRGELVCAAPFPSRPVGLFGDPDRSRFHRAYFAQREGVWTHGDLVDLTERGAARILGRCDGILNIRGIRIGPGEIYAVLAAFPEVAQAMAADQEALDEPGGRRLVLAVVLKAGHTLDRALTLRIKKELKQRASAAHVPAVIAQVGELPTTFSGKRSEAALQDALNGRPVRNAAALRNPGCVEEIVRRIGATAAPPR
jgi:acetoacetyl-CoA synthetase